ncbi:hypothetical protein FRB94_004521 [Tulasnella sp. JGI-2019a]|nr:hypothetical protein FRB93_003160 [Tulasnella sp. JGI-2019a]KAG9001806.1 hypothetical protein FRB94_004521 [Tulasnella sp. JGI-2019a]KAG9033042.1 hypothetical protein FRB95_000627 [Tulasnella sp. JGI-2019a]
MARHSKNNTSNSVFSYAEYKKLDYGTKRQRIGVDSMRERLGCALCLQRARDPVACSEGHLYCKECIYTDLLEQKKEIKRQQVTLEQLAKDEEEEKQKKRVEARERVLKDFEERQLGLGGKKSLDVPAIMDDSTNAAEKKGLTETFRGTKRKFDFDQDEVDTLAREAEDVALQQIEKEQAESRRAKLPAFWLPSLTPDSALGPLKDIKLQTLCHATEPAHTLSLKSLVPVTFTFATGNQASTSASVSDSPTVSTSTSTEPPDAICPSCKKQLSNSSIAYLIRSCSHVVCKTCVETLVKPAKQCVVCDKKCKDRDVVELAREGTGYAAGGRAETTKASVAFQG